MATLISNGGTVEEISNLARQNGTKLLRDNVVELVKSGVTTMDELMKTTYSI
jgi:type IV pilus assembly protein PilB